MNLFFSHKIRNIIMLTTLIIGGIYMGSQLTYQHNSSPTFNIAAATGDLVANDDIYSVCESGFNFFYTPYPTGNISLDIDVLANDTTNSAGFHKLFATGTILPNGTAETIFPNAPSSSGAFIRYTGIYSSGMVIEFDYIVTDLNSNTGTATVQIEYSQGNCECTQAEQNICVEKCEENSGDTQYCQEECQDCKFPIPTCGNGNTEPGETCDDGNTTPGDGCSNTCQIEDGYSCQGTPSSCSTVCGDGKKVGNEQCDDDNTQSGDGCSSSCQIEHLRCQPNNTCSYQTSSGGVACTTGSDCGQSQSPITCDNIQLIQTPHTNINGSATHASVGFNNTANTDHYKVSLFDPGHGGIRWERGDSPIQGSSRSINDTLPNSYLYTDQSTNYTISVNLYNQHNQSDTIQCALVVDHTNNGGGSNSQCGNGIIDTGETCDDSNTTPGDGCSNTCQIEDGYSCQGTPSSCSTVCGDGKKAGNEQCDDDNTQSGDGCSSTCQRERPSCNDVNLYGPTERNDRIYVRLQKDNDDRPLKIKNIERGDGNSENGINTLPESHYYINRGEYDITYTLVHADSTSLQRDCSQTVIVRSLKGCTDTKANNYDPNATEDDGSCQYIGGNANCGSIQFSSTANNASVGEMLFFSRNNHNITSAGFYAGAGNFNNNATSPISYSYTTPGQYTAQLIITNSAGTSQTCTLPISIGESGCTQPGASNYNPNATKDDGSCRFGGGSSIHCGDRKLQIGEECDDGNRINGDGCSDVCQIESGYAPYCGNNIIEIGEQCDGDLQCNAQCQIAYNNPSDRYQDELCRIYGICNGGVGNRGDPATTPITIPPVTLPTPISRPSMPTPDTLPASGPDEDRAKEQFTQRGIEMIESPTVNLDNIDRYHTMDESDPLFADPLYRIQNILPAPYRQSESYIVAPSIGTVTPIQTIQDKQTLTNFMIGDGEGYQDYLNQGAVYYPFTPRPGKQGNTVIFGHSSSYDIPGQQPIGNVFKLLPLLEQGDIYYIVTRQETYFVIYQYQVNKKQIINPDQVNVIDQNLIGHKSTLMTCYPIGTDQDRYIVEGLPMSTMRNVSYSQLLDVLSMPQEIQLRALAESYRQQYNQTQRQGLIQQLQTARAGLIQQSNLSPAQKQHRDSIRQYLIYHLAQ